MALKRAAVTTTETTATQASPEQAQETVKEPVAEQVLETREEQAQAEADQAAAAGAQFEDGAQQDVVHEQEAQVADVEQASQTEQVTTEAKDEVVAEQVQAKEVAVAQGGAVAVASSGQDAVRGAMAQYTQDMAALGFEGLTVDGMSFDRVKLDEGKFVLGSEEISLGESIDIQLLNTRPIFIVRQRDADDSPMYFSYDAKGDFTTSGESAQAIKDEWLEEGYGTADEPLDIKRYLEGMAQLVNRTDEWAGHMVSLSIPPASTSRLGGACMTGKQRFGRDPSGLVITCKVGQKIQKGNISWRPWVFIAKGPYDA